MKKQHANIYMYELVKLTSQNNDIQKALDDMDASQKKVIDATKKGSVVKNNGSI